MNAIGHLNNQDATTSTTAGSGTLADLEKRVKAGHFEEAEAGLSGFLQENGDNEQALYLHAVSLRYLERYDEALQTLDSLKAINPSYGRAWQESAHNYRQLNQKTEAIQDYRQAVELNPGLLASWQSLSRLLANGDGQQEQALMAKAQAERLEKLPAALQAVSSMIHENRLYKAEKLCRHFLQQNPHHVEAMRLLAVIGSSLNITDDAEFLLESCLEFEPDNALARYDYINLLHKRQKYSQALEQARILQQSQPGNPSFETALANQHMAVGETEKALTAYQKLLTKLDENPHLYMAYGHALKTVGQQEEAVTAYQNAARFKPQLGDAWWSLANLKTYRFSDEEISKMKALEANKPLVRQDHWHLCFALGKALEDRKAYEESYQYYERGNDLKNSELLYDPEAMQADFERQKSICTSGLFEQHQGAGSSARDPIFIVGLPRAGSTLLEQILASHSQIEGTMELPHILATAHRLAGRRKKDQAPLYPACLSNLETGQLKALGEKYLEDTRMYREGKARFIDKMPNNFRHIGLIKLMLPKAKIIDARRHPMSCCFSAYKQLFAEGQEFSYSQANIANYYRGYVDLMKHWDEVLPGHVLRVDYESVVADLEGQARRILDFLELPFEDQCLEFHQTRRAIRTASSEQVRQPIYTHGLDYWRHYENKLQEMKEILGDLVQ